jgi:hypothetical protein
MTTNRTIGQSLTRVLLITGVLLAIPLVANLLTTGEGWSLFDFALAGGLIMGAGMAYELAVKRPGSRTAAVVPPLVAATGGAAVIIGEVDDAPGLILMGFALVLTAIVIGIKAVGGRAAAA